MNTVKTAIVGYGYAGRVFHAQLVNATPGLKLKAVSSRSAANRRRAEGEYGLTTYATIDELLVDEDVELVVIATPHDTHMELVVKSLEAGKHVVTDKIMCLDGTEAGVMIKAARDNDRMLSVFHNRRWDCDYLTLKKVLEEGFLGDLLVVESSVVSFAHPSPDSWRSQRKHGGGTFRDWGAHLMDQALQLIPSPVVSVYCDLLYTEPRVDVETSARCYLTFASGVRYIIETGWISPLPRPRWHVRGTKGAFEKYGLDPQEDALRKGVVDENLKQPPGERARIKYETGEGMETMTLETVPGSWPSFYNNIADHLLQGTELSVKPEEMYRLMQVYDAADESVETGQVVECEI